VEKGVIRKNKQKKTLGVQKIEDDLDFDTDNFKYICLDCLK